MNQMKKIVSTGVAVMLSLAMISVSYARYSNIVSFTVTGKVNTTSVNGKASVYFEDAVESTLTIYLERSSNGGASYNTYRVLDEQSGKDYSLVAQGEASGLNPNYEYRIKAEVVVDGGETEYKYLY